MRIAVIGHVEHVTIARVPALPAAGDIVHLDEPVVIAGGGGGIAFFQLTRSSGEIHLFTALGNDDGAAAVEVMVRQTGASVHAARRDEPHTRDIVVITTEGERTIFVVGRPLHPCIDDPLPWDVLRSCDAAYFTGQDPAVLCAARAAPLLVVTARRAEALARSGVRADVVVGSAADPRERRTLAEYALPPRALVMTEGAAGGRIETADGVVRFDAPPAPATVVGAYGAGDSFSAALTWYVARGMPMPDACVRASAHGAAVLRGINPIAGQAGLEA
jgi:ribokinase